LRGIAPPITVGQILMTLYDAIPKDGRPTNDALLEHTHQTLFPVG
jgi:hypothetical protein